MQIDIKHPHDSIFKNIFDDITNTKDFLQAYLPNDLVKQIDFKSMKQAPTEKRAVENAKENKYDLSVECLIGKQKSRVYIIFEHKSYKDKHTIMQILRYCLVLWGNELRNNRENLTPVIPFIFYHGEDKVSLPDNFRDYFEVDESMQSYLLDFKMVIFDTNRIEDEEIKQKIKHNAFMVSSILLLKNIFRDIDDWKPVLKSIIELDDDRKIMLFEYIVTKKDITEDKFNKIIIEMKGDEMPSLAEIWMERGEEKGKKEGILEEIHDTIRMGLEFKFSQISDKLLLTIEKINEMEKLKKIKRAIFNIDDVNEFQQFVRKTI